MALMSMDMTVEDTQEAIIKVVLIFLDSTKEASVVSD